jgi:anti-anti-sigma regulatory factor
MNVKIDTKEIFHVISIMDSELTANMSETLLALIAKKQEEETKSIILNFEMVQQMDKDFTPVLTNLNENLYAESKSFVICNLSENVKQNLSNWGILETINHTPTESEAWDIVQMEEIERELGMEFPE